MLQSERLLHYKLDIKQSGHKSCGVSPVWRAIRVSIRGPISTLSWKAKTKSGQPTRARIL